MKLTNNKKTKHYSVLQTKILSIVINNNKKSKVKEDEKTRVQILLEITKRTTAPEYPNTKAIKKMNTIFLHSV